MIEELTLCENARIPVVWFVTHEERRAEAEIVKYFRDLMKGDVFIWSLTSGEKGVAGWQPPDDTVREKVKIPFAPADEQGEIATAIQSFVQYAEKVTEEAIAQDDYPKITVGVFRDPHVFLEEDMTFRRVLRDARRQLEGTNATIVCISPVDTLPTELSIDVAKIYPGLPGKKKMTEFVEDLLDRITMPTEAEYEDGIAAKCAEACMGMTLQEAEDTIQKSLSKFAGKLDLQFISKAKAEVISKIPGLTYEGEMPSMEDVGGLEGLKEWMSERKGGFSPEARKFGLPAPKGILCLGIPGCLHKDTPIYDPVDRSTETVEERYKRAKPFHVLSMDKDGLAVIAKADKPYLYPEAKMIEFIMDSGEKIRVTHGHRFWDGQDWSTALKLFSLFQEGVEVLLPSSPEHEQKVPLTDTRCSVIFARETEPDKYYDFHVPNYENYAACGLWHHNTGKSLFSKAVAAELELPLIALSTPDLKGGIVGETEENVRRAFDAIDKIGKSVVRIDEMEKGLPTTGGRNLDAGASDAVLGGLLKWMQDRKGESFLVATANDISAMRPELLRKGRFDAIFFVDLPSTDERMQIFEIHLRKKDRKLSKAEIKELSMNTAGYSGAEIEAAVIDGLWKSWSNNRRKLNVNDIISSIKMEVPLSKTMREEIQALRNWAKDRARFASKTRFESEESEDSGTTKKKPLKKKLKFEAEKS